MPGFSETLEVTLHGISGPAISGDAALTLTPRVSEKRHTGKIAGRTPVAVLVIVPAPDFRGAGSPNASLCAIAQASVPAVT